MNTVIYSTIVSFALTFLLLLSACSADFCGDLVYDEPNETCVCPPGTEPDYDLDACVGADIVISWAGHTVPYRMDAGPGGDAGPRDAMRDILTVDMGMSIDVGADALDLGQDLGHDTGPPPADVIARYPWNGLCTGSVHVPDDEPVVNHPLRPKFMWEEVSGASHYQIQLTRECTTEGFGACAFERVALDEITTDTTFRPASSLRVSMTVPVGSRYFWRVRACVAIDVCSAWTAVRYLDVGRDTHDYNGDGYGDVVVSASGASAPESGEGNVFVYFGSATGIQAEPDLTLDNPMDQAGGGFGAALGAAGDVNGDGFAELLVGAPKQDAPEQDEGVAYLFFGSPGGPVRPDIVFDNPENEVRGNFGVSVAGVGDVNGDGFADVVSCATYTRTSGAGRAYVYFGAAGGPSGFPSRTLTNPRMGRGGFGETLAGGGDFDGDGFTDFVVGAPQESGGAVYAYSGGSALGRFPPIELDNPLAHESADFGFSLLFAGDLNSDGLADLVVGAPSQDEVDVLDDGPFIYWGTPSGPNPSDVLPVNNPGPKAAFGHSLAAGDVNGDGSLELAVAAPFYSPTGEAFDWRGRVYLHLGRRVDGPGEIASVVESPSGAEGEGLLGNSLSGGTDINGDGYADVIIGAFAPGGNKVYVLFGASGSLPTVPGNVVRHLAGEEVFFGDPLL